MPDESSVAAHHRLRLLIERSPGSQQALADVLTGGSIDSLADLISGVPDLDLTQLALAADVLDVPLRVLTGELSLESDLGISLRLGGLSEARAPEGALRVAAMMLRNASLLDYWLGPVDNRFRGLMTSPHRLFLEAGKRTALHVRDLLGVGDQPLDDLVSLVEAFGFAVSHIALPDGVHGLNVRQESDGETRRVIIVNCAGDYWTRQRFTLAHELCHGVYDDPGQVIIDEIEVPDTLPELRAESFARHLLLTERALQREFDEGRGQPPAVFIARMMITYGISRTALLNAMVHDHLVSPDQVASLRNVSVAALMDSAGLTDAWVELSRRQHEPSGSPLLASRALIAYREGLIARERVAELFGREDADIAMELAEQGWDPVEAD
jgi:hypothetical protein